MITKLIVASGKHAGKVIAVKRNRLLIGRAEECDIRPLSEQVSRRHCAVHVGPSDVWVEDLGSRNGTFVNGVKIGSRVQAADGALIRVGPLELKVSCFDPAARGGGEDDVSSWLLAEDDSTGGFDTTQARLDAAPEAGSADAPAPPQAESVGPGEATPAAGAAAPAPAASTAGPGGAAASARTVSIEAIKASLAQPGTLSRDDGKKDRGSSREAAAEALKKFFDRR